MQGRTKQAAFTLIELLIAITLTAMIGLAAHTMLHVLLGSQEQLSSHQKTLENLDTGLRILQRDLRQIAPITIEGNDYRHSSSGFLLRPVEMSYGDAFLEFAKYKVTPDNASHSPELIRVKYTLQDEQLIREETPYSSINDETSSQAIIILKNVTGIGIEIYLNSWATLHNSFSQGELPRGIKFNFISPKWHEANLVIPFQ